jgi:hypothetical protein
MRGRAASKQQGDSKMRLLLLLPFIALLWIPFYNRDLPALFGFPFFYWYQLLWVPLTAVLIWIVFRHRARFGDLDEEQQP